MTGAQRARPVARGARRGGRVRHPGRRDPAGVRPALRLRRSGTSWSATSRARGTPRPATRRPPARSASAWPPPARARPTWSPRSPTPTWTRCRSWRSPARCRGPRSARTPSRRPTSRASRCRSPSTTTWCRRRRRSRGSWPRRSTWPRTGRPGPVLVDIPKDVLQAQTTFAWPPTLDLPGYRPTLHPHGKQIREAARLIAQARSARCSTSAAACSRPAPPTALRKLAELTGMPVVTTLMARGAFPDSHPQHLGMPGMHGTVAGGVRAAEGRPAGRAGRPLRRPGHRQAGLVRAGRARSCTPTSTRPRSARTGTPTCRSWATPST